MNPCGPAGCVGYIFMYLSSLSLTHLPELHRAGDLGRNVGTAVTRALPPPCTTILLFMSFFSSKPTPAGRFQCPGMGSVPSSPGRSKSTTACFVWAETQLAAQPRAGKASPLQRARKTAPTTDFFFFLLFFPSPAAHTPLGGCASPAAHSHPSELAAVTTSDHYPPQRGTGTQGHGSPGQEQL